MITIKAIIKLHDGELCRNTPFISGYRPLFNFVGNLKTSGQITLIKQELFFPGEEDIVEISFLNSDYLGSDFGDGKKFTFSEGSHILGEGKVLEILN